MILCILNIHAHLWQDKLHQEFYNVPTKANESGYCCSVGQEAQLCFLASRRVAIDGPADCPILSTAAQGFNCRLDI